jgi:UDP-N-acetylmuramyl pentapeptide synthase
VLGVILILLAPFIAGCTLTAVVFFAHIFIAAPQEKQLMEESKRTFSIHPAIKIGVAGSYGKTTFKEIINTVLGET